MGQTYEFAASLLIVRQTASVKEATEWALCFCLHLLGIKLFSVSPLSSVVKRL